MKEVKRILLSQATDCDEVARQVLSEIENLRVADGQQAPTRVLEEKVGDANCYVAYSYDRSPNPLGFLSLQLYEGIETAWIQYCYVSKQARARRHSASGQGLGSLMVGRAVEVAGNKNKQRVRLIPTDDSVGFYKKMGFALVYGRGDPYMEKTL